ncbi:polysaccharide pyruvyl transferase family protein [Microbacterium thalassium]|uniref:Polysaccharide pyruvyl transferase WcaK-like protein n=1 Tax=Microbacterium thalassium TaxID=362649 RepID=A0A7X0KTL6_9MICO|nr:polysaccharide pyruvyl transferase family protein [Microbacterium thalassium]MBB6390270.1 polysaccharide pyruvyl transferase WcaK-like protein [Microbacterium thalassium]
MRPPAWLLAPLRSPAALRAVDRVALHAAPSAGGDGHVVLAPPGRGNIGDQALVEAFVEAVEGPVTVIVRAPDDIDIPERLAPRMRTVALPALVYGSAVGRARDLRRLNSAVAGAATFAILGADIMDGAYVARASVGRALLARRFAELGWDCRVIGFSWNAAPAAVALDALRSADRAGSVLYVRDPRSAERARGDGLRAQDSADIVFTAASRDPGVVDRLLPDLAPEEPLALVNASGLVGARLGGYADAIRRLRESGRRVLIVPHVSRHGADDIPLCTALADVFAADAGVVLVPELLTPPEIRSLGARASVVVTGRMHLAVMSLTAGTPALTVATQGKVEGLMDLFGTPELCIAPGDDFDHDLPAAVQAVIAQEDSLRSRILAARDEVVSRAWRNVDGMAAAIPDSDEVAA